ncbi:hypothetical protein BA768_01125 [Chryseobacterium sp. CBo1]|uniref:hypothetical protein n=1 Tax=Chryseobacterium sp. CBo1 TaxID=1869230 RepID=UPI000810AAA9|nr:hypothetical protein [Chryseobacterium sp. CBo1]OCK53186.1 hypothetical protein BA768_01125 [Chryseobacterium sp. CBo1]
MKTVKAKFKCEAVTNFETAKEVKLSAVYGTSEENKDFSKYTPSGHLSIRIDNETEASTYFEPGSEYYLEFSKVEIK